MTDFRISKIRKVAEALGLKETYFSEEKMVLIFTGKYYFQFAEEDININVDCIEIPYEKKLLISTFCELMNTLFQNLKFAVVDTEVFACSSISNTIFMREDSSSELYSVIHDIMEDSINGTKHIYELLNK